MKQTLTAFRVEIGSNTIIVGDFNTPLSKMYRKIRQKMSKEIDDLNNTTDHLGLIDIYRILYPTIPEYTFFLSTHEAFSKADHMLGYKIGLNNQEA